MKKKVMIALITLFLLFLIPGSHVVNGQKTAGGKNEKHIVGKLLVMPVEPTRDYFRIVQKSFRIFDSEVSFPETYIYAVEYSEGKLVYLDFGRALTLQEQQQLMNKANDTVRITDGLRTPESVILRPDDVEVIEARLRRDVVSEVIKAQENPELVESGQAESMQLPQTGKAAIILFQLAGDTRPFPISQGLIRNHFANAKAWARDNSYNKYELRGDISPEVDIYGPYIVSTDVNSACSAQAFLQQKAEAFQQATAPGPNRLDPSKYNMFYFSRPNGMTSGTNCNFSAFAVQGIPQSMDPRESYLVAPFDFSTLTHETEHMWGDAHGSGYDCFQASAVVVFPQQCNHDEYGDILANIGAGGGFRISPYGLLRLGFIGPQQARFVTPGSTQSYFVFPSEPPQNAKKVLVLISPAGVNASNEPMYYFYSTSEPHNWNQAFAILPYGMQIRYGPDPGRATNTWIVKMKRTQDPVADFVFVQGDRFFDGIRNYEAVMGVYSKGRGMPVVFPFATVPK